MTLVNPPHGHFSQDHLEHVVREMMRRGPPVLRAYLHDDGVWHAREGTHRLRAAKLLEVAPVLVPVPWGRSPRALTRASFAELRNAHEFERVDVRGAGVVQLLEWEAS